MTIRFFILKKQLASQNMFLLKSELSITTSHDTNRTTYTCFAWAGGTESRLAQLRGSNRGQWFFVWGSFLWQAHHYPNQGRTALMEAAIVSKMQTPAIILWFFLLSFFILEKQLASQNMFLTRSKLSITPYLFLVLYRSTASQSQSFVKNIKSFLCK